MVLMDPYLSARKSGNNIKEGQYTQSYSKNYYSRRFSKKKLNNNSFTSTRFKPLTAAEINSTQIAFKGLSFSRVFGPLRKFFSELTESQVAKAGSLQDKIAESVHVHELSGLKDILGHVDRKGLREESIFVIKPITETFPDAILSLPRMLKSVFKKVFGGKDLREQIRAAERNKAKLDSLLGYFLEIKKIGKGFDKAFSGENLKKLKDLLRTNNYMEARALLESNGVKSKVLLGGNGPNDKVGFGQAATKLFQKLEDGVSVEQIRKDYITGFISNEEWEKAGSILPGFGGNSVQLVTRVTTGLVGAGLIANDFYNLKMLTTDDKEKAKKERNRMFKQQAAYTAFYAYLGFLINSTFIRMVNRSLNFAVGVGAATAVAANIISRKINGIPVLPVHHKKLSKEPYVIHAAPISQDSSIDYSMPAYRHSKTFRAFKGNLNNNLSFSGYGLSSARALIRSVDQSLQRAMPATMNYEDFVAGHRLLQEIGEHETARLVLKASAKHTRHQRHLEGILPKRSKYATIEDLEKAAKANNGKVVIGVNSLYKLGRSIVDTILFPIKLLVSLGRMSTNLVLKALGKNIIPKPEKEKMGDEIRVRNFFKWSKQAREKSAKTNIPAAELLGENLSRFRSPNVMEYSNSDLSSLMKLTGFITVPFLAVNAYNTAAEETGNVHLSVEKAKHRTLQDTTRQGISFWMIKSWNDMFKPLNNYSLLSSGVSTTLSCAGYEVLTRVFVGQPITPKTHEEMKAIEKKRLKNDSWLARAMGRKIKMHEDKIALHSEELRDFPGVQPNNNKLGFKFITKTKNAKNSEFDKFINSLPPLPEFELY